MLLVRIVILIWVRDTSWGHSSWLATVIILLGWLLLHVAWLASWRRHLMWCVALGRGELTTWWLLEGVVPLHRWGSLEPLRRGLPGEVAQTLNQVIFLELSADLEIVDVLEQFGKVVRELCVELVRLMKHICDLEVAGHSLIELLIENLFPFVLLRRVNNGREGAHILLNNIHNLSLLLFYWLHS